VFNRKPLCPEDLPAEVWAAVAANYSTDEWKPSPAHHVEYRDARTAVEAYKALMNEGKDN
jgi:hypothetical protein